MRMLAVCRKSALLLPTISLILAIFTIVPAAINQSKVKQRRSTGKTSSRAAIKPPAKPSASTSLSKEAAGRRLVRPVTGESAAEKFREDPNRRRQEFLFPRLYPFKELPANARQLAWQARERATGARQASDQQWISIGPKPTISAYQDNWGFTSGRINSIAVAPDDAKLVLVGTATGGIWRSTDSGATFLPVTDDQIDLAVGSIAFSASDSKIVYAGLGDPYLNYLGSGVLKSTDGGQSWQQINNDTLPALGSTAKITVDPNDANRVFLALSVQQSNTGSLAIGGFYLSTDGGVNWKQTLSGIASDLVIDEANSNVLYLAMTVAFANGNRMPAGIYRSKNGGKSWKILFTSPYRDGATRDIKVAVTPANAKTIYIYTGGFTTSSFDIRVLKSINSGKSFKNLGSQGIDREQFGYNTYLFVAPDNADTVYVGSRDVYKSSNGGGSWTNLNNNILQDGEFNPFASNSHIDQHTLAFSTDNAATLYISNDGGISKSTDAGLSFVSLNKTLTLLESYTLSAHPTDASVLYTGTQDNGLQKKRAGTTWEELISGDYNGIVFDPLHPDTIAIHYIFGDVFAITSDVSFDVLSSNSTFEESDGNPRIAFLAPLVGNGVDEKLYFGSWRLFVSEDFGRRWFPTAGKLDLTKGRTDVLKVIAVSSVNPQVIYTGSEQGRVMVSGDGGKKFTDITKGLPNRSITSITIDRNNPAIAYLTVSGFRSGHIFKTTNMGANWQDISDNLPDIPANALLIDPSNADTLYLGTDIGVFRSTIGGKSWQSFNNGLPPVIVSSFAVTADGTIHLASYGRGVYQLSKQ